MRVETRAPQSYLSPGIWKSTISAENWAQGREGRVRERWTSLVRQLIIIGGGGNGAASVCYQAKGPEG